MTADGRMAPRRGWWWTRRRAAPLAVVLSGGANLGAFQVGVIDVLARAGLEPDLLVGTSVGALNAAFWAFHPGANAGAELREVWRRIDRSTLLGGHPVLALPRLFGGRHLFADGGLIRLLRATLPAGACVEDAAYPLRVVVTRALDGGREVIRRGPLEAAVRASAAIPGVFPAVTIGEHLYVDGGLVANCDLEAVVEAGIGQAIGVDVMAGGFDAPAGDILESASRAVTFLVARQTEMQLRLWGSRLRLVMVRPRLRIPVALDRFVHTDALIDLGRVAGERLLARHVARRWRLRPGLLEVRLPDAAAGPLARMNGAPSALAGPGDAPARRNRP
ncbi:MAG TPA: patatin-like phospholipase family protein [Candidatus Binatia bacterium]|nr:patatin-like phospholipase family protein [Candidatus Binatia bacterium]